MRKILSISIFVLLCLTKVALAEEKYPCQKIADNFIKAQATKHAVSALFAMTENGDTLLSWNSHQRMTPASNMKLLSTGAALLSLGPDYRYTTQIGYEGEIIDSTLHGNLYIIGCGDPTLASHNKYAKPIAKTFAQWHKIVLDAGINTIDGFIIGDGEWIEGMKEHGSWCWEDIGTYYGTGVSGLNFYENVISFNINPGQEIGSPLSIKQKYPQTSWMNFSFPCTTGPQGTGDKLYLYTTDLSPVGELRGTFAVDRSTKTIYCSNKFPEYTCAVYFKNYLQARGIKCTKGASDLGSVFNFSSSTKNKKKTIIGESKSIPLARIAEITNFDSNNLYADILFRTMGKHFGEENSFEESSNVMIETLEDLLKMDANPESVKVLEEVQITDGSGLSRKNFLSAAFLATYLKAIMKTPAWESFLSSLPSPGSEGSMQNFMSNYPIELKNRIRLKSGSMNGIRCYSGYILPSKQGTQARESVITFSIMANNFTAPQHQVQKEIEKAIANLAEYNS